MNSFDVEVFAKEYKTMGDWVLLKFIEKYGTQEYKDGWVFLHSFDKSTDERKSVSESLQKMWYETVITKKVDEDSHREFISSLIPIVKKRFRRKKDDVIRIIYLIDGNYGPQTEKVPPVQAEGKGDS